MIVIESIPIPQCNRPSTDARNQSPRVAYMMSRFPKITETFILYEMLAAENAGARVEVFPLRRERTKTVHPEARAYVERAHFLPLLSPEIVRDNLIELLKRPRIWLQTLWMLIRANFGCLRFLLGALAVFPKCVTAARQMQRAGIDHIHAHFASHPAAAAWIIHQFSGIPYSLVANGSDLHRDRHMLTQKVHAAAFVVAISKYNRRIILEHTDDRYADKVKVIHCGVDPDDFDTGANRSSHTQPTGLLKVYCIGTLHEVKGQRYLIEAAQKVKSRGIGMMLHFIGDGPDRKMLERQVALAGLTDSIFFEGSRNRQQIVEHLATADVLVAPSVPTRDGRREGIPVVLMEAMASGVPVIASRLSGIPELIEHEVSGLLADARNTEGIASALQRLGSDPLLRQQLGEAGRKTVRENFNLEVGARRVLRWINVFSAEQRSSTVTNTVNTNVETRPWM